jgi:hypothetical protein
VAIIREVENNHMVIGGGGQPDPIAVGVPSLLPVYARRLVTRCTSAFWIIVTYDGGSCQCPDVASPVQISNYGY